MSLFADTIIVGANVVTLDALQPAACALAIRGGCLVAVGDERTVMEYRSSGTEVIDLGGKTVTPGLIDAHMHPALGAIRAIGADFAGVTDPEQALSLLRGEAERAHVEGAAAWVRVQNLDYELFARLPMTSAAIEDAVGGLPALLFLFDGHTALASHAALKLAGIQGAEEFADGSRIVVDDAGRPTGQLNGESAIDRVLEVAPVPSTAESVATVRGILADLSASGFTGGCIMDGSADSFDLLDEVDATDGGLPLRLVTAFDHGPGDDEDQLRARLALRDRRGARWRGGLVKLYADGVIDTGSAWLYDPDTHGGGTASFWKDYDAFRRTVQRYHDGGFQIATHAIGDKAIGSTIGAYRAAGPRRMPSPAHRIEHLECMADGDLGRMAAAGVTASVQPLHMQWRKADGSDTWSSRLGPERAARAWRVRDMIDAGLRVALGSDWPVAQLDSRIGMAWARLRRIPGQPDAHVFEPDQVLSPVEALLGFTRWAAEAQGDLDTGIIRPGYRADLVVWDENPLVVDADHLIEVPVHTTLVDGKATYRAADSMIP
jgi:predicted amidohydrolase YtcJ